MCAWPGCKHITAADVAQEGYGWSQRQTIIYNLNHPPGGRVLQYQHVLCRPPKFSQILWKLLNFLLVQLLNPPIQMAIRRVLLLASRRPLRAGSSPPSQERFWMKDCWSTSMLQGWCPTMPRRLARQALLNVRRGSRDRDREGRLFVKNCCGTIW